MSHLYDLAIDYAKANQKPAGETSWHNNCAMLCYRFTSAEEGWAKAPKTVGPYASSVANASGWLNTNYAAAPIGAYHFWTIPGTVAGHVGQDLNGGGTSVFMATAHVAIKLAEYLGINSVPGYTASVRGTYRGWSTNYGGGISAYKEPVVGPKPNQRLALDALVWGHKVPITTPPTSDAATRAGQVPAGALGTFTAYRNDGESVKGNPIWFYGIDGLWYWSGGFKDSGTHDLTQYIPPVVTPPVEPTPPIVVTIPVEEPPVVVPDPPVVGIPNPPVETTPPVVVDPPTHLPVPDPKPVGLATKIINAIKVFLANLKSTS